MGLALVAGLAAVAGAGLTSLWLNNQRSVPPQYEPQTVAVSEVRAPETQSPSLNDIPLSQPVPQSDGATSTAPAVKSAERPAIARRRAPSESVGAPAAPSTKVPLASSSPGSSSSKSSSLSSATPQVPPAPEHQPRTPVQAVAVPEPPASPRTPFFASTDVTEPPQVTSRVEPRLPDELVKSPVNDVVVVRLLVSHTGQPFRIRLHRHSKAGAQLDDAVIAAMNRWTFSPARKNGEAVSCWLNVGVPIKSSRVEASTTSVAKLGEAQTADQPRHTSRSRQ